MKAARIVDAAPDWITVTAKNPKKQRALVERARMLMGQLSVDGYTEKIARRRGGLSGVQVGPVASTAGNGLTMVEIRGTVAGDYAGEFAALGDNVSRIDGQVTVLLEDPDPDVPGKLRQNVYRRRRRGTVGRGRQPSARILDGDRSMKDGDGHPIESATLYLGSRSSERHRRVYDKGIQGGMIGYWVDLLGGETIRAGSLWRFECAYKEAAADVFVAGLPQEGRTEAVARYVKGAVWSDFDRVGARPPWKESTPVRLVPYREETDDERFARWFADQVMPAAHNRAETSEDLRRRLVREFAEQMGVNVQDVGNGSERRRALKLQQGAA